MLLVQAITRQMVAVAGQITHAAGVLCCRGTLVIRAMTRPAVPSTSSRLPVRAGGVPLFEQFVQDLGDPVVDRVAERRQELFLALHGQGLSAGSGWAGGGCLP